MTPRHRVQFYEQDEYLIAKLGEFFGEGFDAGEAAIVIANPEHRLALARALTGQGRNPEVLEHKGRLVFQDAQETLFRVLRNDLPDESLLQGELESLLARTAGPVRAYGEMADLLRAEGREDAAGMLEEMWGKAMSGAGARLLCAYPIGAAGSAVPRPFRDLGSRRLEIFPSESFSSEERTEEQRRHTAAELQQRAAALEAQAREAERLFEDIRLSHDLVFSVTGSATFEEALREILRHALAAYQADQGLAHAPGKGGEGIRIAAGPGLPDGFPEWIEGRTAAEAGAVFGEAEENPLVVEDFETDPRFREWRGAARKAGIRAALCLRLASREGKPFGALAVLFHTPRKPSERESKFGAMYARLASDALEKLRARLESAEEQERRRAIENECREKSCILAALNRAATRLASERDAESIARTVLKAGKEITGAEYGAFFRGQAEGQGPAPRWSAFSGDPALPVAVFPAPSAVSGLGPALAGWGPVRIEDIRHGVPQGKPPARSEEAGPLRSFLALPVVSRAGELLGGLFYGHSEPGRFGKQAEENLESLAALAAVAIANAGLYAALQKRIEQGRAREREARHFAAIVASSNDAIASKGLDSIVLSWNKAAERIFGYTAEEMIGTSITRLMPEKYLDEEPEILRRIQAGETINHYETVRRRKDGKLIDISLTVSPIKDEEGRIVGASKVARDITDIKAAEGQLRQAQKMEAVGRLAGGVAHDFNNLLTSILGFVDMALAETDPESDVAEYLGEVRKAGYRASTLTQQLLAYSRKQVLSPRVIDLNECILDLDRMLRRLLGEDLEFRTRLDPELCPIKADRGQMQQVIMNLALNARDAMPGGGQLTVETENVHLDRAYAAAHPGTSAGPHVRLTVRDTGTGIPDEVLPHIFEPFFTTKEQGKGTGLGLSSVYGIVKQSGGSISVESHTALESNGRPGTVFRIHFPALDGKGRPLKEAQARGREEAGGHGETILLAEDESAVRKFLVAALKSQGYRVVEAKDGAEALELGSAMDRIDLVVTDVVMPGIGGGKLAAGLKSIHPGAEFLYISGYAKDAQSLRELGESADFLQKPFTQADLLSKAREALSRSAKRGRGLPSGG